MFSFYFEKSYRKSSPFRLHWRRSVRSHSLQLLLPWRRTVSRKVDLFATAVCFFPPGFFVLFQKMWLVLWFWAGKLDVCDWWSSFYFLLAYLVRRSNAESNWGYNLGCALAWHVRCFSASVEAVSSCHGASVRGEFAWSTMGERKTIFFFLFLATQLRLSSTQVLRIGKRNSCLRTALVGVSLRVWSGWTESEPTVHIFIYERSRFLSDNHH